MKNWCLGMIVAVLAMLSMVAAGAQRNTQAEAMMAAAQQKENVEGDLPAAIKQYKDIATRFASNHAVAATALLRLAECYQKLGDAESRKIYQEVISKYGDQKAAVEQARARLGGTAPRETVVSKIWSGDTRYSFIGVSPDGRYLIGKEGSQPGLFLHDVASNTDRRLTSDLPANSINPFALFTPDSKRIVYTYLPDVGPLELRIVNVDGTGGGIILSNSEYATIEPSGITADGKTVAVTLGRRDNTWQVGMVSLGTGKITILKNNDWRDTYVGNFSPDGRWLTYFVQVSKNESAEGAVYAVATDGSEQNLLIPAHAVNRAPLFTPDGSRVVFRNSLLPNDLWSVPVADGKRIGTPELAKSGTGGVIGFARDGSVYYSVSNYHQDIYVAEVDPVTWKMKNAPKEISNGVRNSGIYGLAWSPDGKLLAFAWIKPGSSGSVEETRIVLHSFDGAPDRELSAHANRFTLHGWSADGKSLVISDREKGMRLFDTETQREQVILGPNPQVDLSESTWDGKAVFYPTFDASGPLGQRPAQAPVTDTIRLMRRDLQTGEEREMFHAEAQRRGPYGPVSVMLSPDGRSLGLYFLRPDGQPKDLLLPVSGGGPREIPSAGEYGSWTQDGNALLFSKSDEIWIQPVDGGLAYGTGIRSNQFLIAAPRVHPDGSRIAFTLSTRNNQVWTIKNLFNETSAAK